MSKFDTTLSCVLGVSLSPLFLLLLVDYHFLGFFYFEFCFVFSSFPCGILFF